MSESLLQSLIIPGAVVAAISVIAICVRSSVVGKAKIELRAKEAESFAAVQKETVKKDAYRTLWNSICGITNNRTYSIDGNISDHQIQKVLSDLREWKDAYDKKK